MMQHFVSLDNELCLFRGLNPSCNQPSPYGIRMDVSGIQPINTRASSLLAFCRVLVFLILPCHQSSDFCVSHYALLRTHILKLRTQIVRDYNLHIVLYKSDTGAPKTIVTMNN